MVSEVGGSTHPEEMVYLHVGDRVSYTLRVVDPVDRKRPGTAALQSKWHVAD